MHVSDFACGNEYGYRGHLMIEDEESDIVHHDVFLEFAFRATFHKYLCLMI